MSDCVANDGIGLLLCCCCSISSVCVIMLHNFCCDFYIHCVSKKDTEIFVCNFLKIRQSKDAIFSHLTYLLFLHYLTKLEIQKLYLFV